MEVAIIKEDVGYVRLRGLPFTCNEAEIKEFFGDLVLSKVKFTTGYDGRPNGEAFVEFPNKSDEEKALKCDRKNIKGRYIEVFVATPEESSNVFQNATEVLEGHVVRLRGLPWSCTDNDIKNFFEGLEPVEIVIGKMGGPRGRASGEAFVKFTSAEEAKKALEFNKRHMGSRYLEVFPSSQIELNREKGIATPVAPERAGIRPLMSIKSPPIDYGYQEPYAGGYDTYGGGYEQQAAGYGGYEGYDGYEGYEGEDPNCRVYMRGLPYEANALMIEKFFAPLRVVSSKIGINDNNRSSGDAIAIFENFQDAASAMGKNNQKMGKRYVELFTHRDVPGPMRRLLWKDLVGYGAPQLDQLLAGRGGAGSGAPRHYDRAPARGGNGYQRGAGYGASRGGGRGGGRGDYVKEENRYQPWATEEGYSWGDEGHYGLQGPQQPQWGGYDPYGNDPYSSSQQNRDRDREPRVNSNPADSWGGWGPADSSRRY